MTTLEETIKRGEELADRLDRPHIGRLARDGATVRALILLARPNIEAHVRGKTDSDREFKERPPHGWTCFHCGETFKTVGGARLHFGKTPDEPAACTVALACESTPSPDAVKGLVEALEQASVELQEASAVFAGGHFPGLGRIYQAAAEKARTALAAYRENG